jgi:tetratricopeptide (TPR) repeat protein
MNLDRQTIVLYGRFSRGARERFATEIVARGGTVARDLTRRSNVLVIGALAFPLVANGALAARLAAAAAANVPVLGERRFASAIAGIADGPCPYPLATALASAGIAPEEAALLAAFDLVRIEGPQCRFADAATFRAAAELRAQGAAWGVVARVLAEARDSAPIGRRKIVLDAGGVPALRWENGLTRLDGQGLLPLDEESATVEDLFEAALVAEAEGNLDAAARLFETCARADRKDPIALYNLGNARLAQAKLDEASLAYRRALARDPAFIEARYNLALALETLGRTDEAARELDIAIATDPTHADAVFNLAQLRLKAGALAEAEALYDRYLALEPPTDWADKARRALTLCRAARTG